MATTNRDKIDAEWMDSDGYWIDLKPGWKNGDDPVGVLHGIHEDTKAEARRTLRSAMECDCEECKQLLWEADERLRMKDRRS